MRMGPSGYPRSFFLVDSRESRRSSSSARPSSTRYENPGALSLVDVLREVDTSGEIPDRRRLP